MLGASRWALGGGKKGAGVPGRKGARLRSFGGAGRVDGGAHTGGRGGDSAHVLVLGGCTHLGSRENAGPFAGARATGSLKGARRVRDHDPSCRARTPSAHGNSNRERASTRQRGARSGTSRGSAAFSNAPDLRSIGSVRCGACSSGLRVGIGSSRGGRALPKGARSCPHREREKRCSRARQTRNSTSPQLVPARRNVLQTSTGRLRSQRSAHAASCWVESPHDENRCP